MLISGAAQGIGRATAEAFRASGAIVHLADIDPQVQDVARDVGGTAHVLDLSDRAGATALVQGIAAQEGRIDILALAAGGIRNQAGLPLEGITEESWEAVFGANVKSALWLSQAAAPFMEKAGWGRIVIVSSGAGLRPSLTGLHAYASAKHAAVGLTKQLSVGLARHGITVNSVAPGFIRSTPYAERQWEGYGEDGQRRLIESFHTKRPGKAQDIATAILFLASEQANWITGQVLSVDGGRS